MSIEEIKDQVGLSQSAIDEHKPPSAADYALVELWAEYEKLQGQVPKWQPVAEAAKNPENLGKTALFQGVIHSAFPDDSDVHVGVFAGDKDTHFFYAHESVEVAVLD